MGMKTLKKENIEQLLKIIQNKPGQRIVHFTSHTHPLIEPLKKLCEVYESHYHLYCTEETYYKECLAQYKEHPLIHVTNFKLRRPRYLMQGIEFDYLFTTLDYTKESKKEFLEKCYPIIRTGGNILIIIPNSNYPERDEWRDILEEQYYVSVTIIDDMFINHDVIVAKRMHGWGN